MSIGKANLYNFDFRNISSLRCDKFEIKRIENYARIEKRVRGQRGYVDNIVTGYIEVDLSGYEEPSVKDLKDYLEMSIKLLSFAQHRDVFFNNFSIEQEGTITGPVTMSMRTGKKFPVPNIRIEGIEDFLCASLPLIHDTRFENETRINRMLDFWHEAVLFTPTVIEVNIPLFFMAFEMVASNYYRNNPKMFLLDDETWENVAKEINGVCDRLGISGDDKSRICGSIGFVKKGSAFEKIMHLLESLELDHHRRDVNEIKNLRNDIFHGDDIKESYGGDTPITLSSKCEKLASKIILKYLGFMDNRHVHGSYFKDRELNATI